MIDQQRISEIFGSEIAGTVKAGPPGTPMPRLPGRCPRCNSPSPELHPAMQHEGEVEICKHSYHDAAKSS